MPLDYTDFQLLDNDYPLPDLSADERYNGPGGVARWFAELVGFLARVEERKHDLALVADPLDVKESNFYFTVKGGEYSAANSLRLLQAEFSVLYGFDLSQLPTATIPTPPAPGPLVIGVSPLQALAGQQVTISGLNLATTTAVAHVGVGTGQILSATGNTIIAVFSTNGTGHVSVTTPAGTSESSQTLEITGAGGGT